MAVVKMAQTLGDEDSVRYYSDIVERGRTVYINLLWNGSYFNYDSSRATHHDSIMADMLAGQWYAQVCGMGTYARTFMSRSRRVYKSVICCFFFVFLFNS